MKTEELIALIRGENTDNNPSRYDEWALELCSRLESHREAMRFASEDRACHKCRERLLVELAK